jgi:hypothetical protein
MDNNSAKLAFILGQNYTHECLTFDYWGAEGPSNDAADRGKYLIEKAKLYAEAPGWAQGQVNASTPSWACVNHAGQTDATALDWLRLIANKLGSNSDSFVNILANAYVNKYGSQYFEFLSNRKRIDFSGGEARVGEPICKTLASPPITICSSTLEFQGDASISNSEIQFVNACNGVGSDTSASNEHPRIFAFVVAYPDENNLNNSNAATLIPIFEGGTGKITTTPALTDPRDLRAIQNNILSGSSIPIRRIMQLTEFTLTVTPPDGTNPVIEKIQIAKVDNIPPLVPTDISIIGEGGILGTGGSSLVGSSYFWIAIIVIIIIAALIFLL